MRGSVKIKSVLDKQNLKHLTESYQQLDFRFSTK